MISKINIKPLFGKLSIYLIAFDSFPIFIGGSIYRPLCLYPILIYFMILCFQKLSCLLVRRNVCNLVKIGLFFGFISIIKGYLYGDLEGCFDFISTGIIGIMGFTVYNDFFSYLAKKTENPFDYVAKLYIKGMYIPIFFGLLQVLSIVLHINFSFLYRFITTRIDTSRVFLVCGEPSWAVLYLIVLYYFLAVLKDKKRIPLKIVTIILILFTFSMLGYLSIIIAIVIYFIFCMIKDIKYLKYLIYGIIITSFIFFLFDKLISLISISPYLEVRYNDIKKLFSYLLTPKTIYNFIQVADNSLFMRLINPVIAIMISLQHPFFGIGGGYYYRYYPEFIKKFFPLATGFSEVNAAVYSGYHTSSKNLFTRFLCEFGLFPGMLILLSLILKISAIKKNDKKIIWLLTLIFTVVFNFDSLCYFLFIFLLCLFFVYLKVTNKSRTS